MMVLIILSHGHPPAYLKCKLPSCPDTRCVAVTGITKKSRRVLAPAALASVQWSNGWTAWPLKPSAKEGRGRLPTFRAVPLELVSLRRERIRMLHILRRYIATLDTCRR